ncbi:hypothetical protein [Dokdonella sp.]|uniref:hypothetical protein n=1 Tax=Dokdonella sp. TaxID=2291710 RepID=UPI0031C7ED2C|nr:hypothetical protein [Dokdonella sp.]
MKAEGKVQEICRSLGSVRAQAVQALREDFPDIYALSAEALDTGPTGGFPHHHRLGEYLSEWNNALGRTPLEALASGKREQVLQELVGRIEGRPSAKERFLLTDFHVAYCDYYATGEGRTLTVAACGSAEGARSVFLQNAPEFFHQGVEVQAITGECTDTMVRIMAWIPQPAVDSILTCPLGAAWYYGVFHYNLS